MGRNYKQYTKIITETDVNVTANDHQMLPSTIEGMEIAYYKVPPQQQVRVGYGDANHPENEGRMYFYIRSGEATPAEITGKVLIVAKNRARNYREVILELDEELLHGDLNDKRKQIPLPVQGPVLGQDYIIAIEVIPKAAHIGDGAGADNVGFADSTETIFKLPLTVRE